MIELDNNSLVFSEKSAKLNLLLELRAKKQIKNLNFINGLNHLTQVKNTYPFFIYNNFKLKPDLANRIKKYLAYIDCSKTYKDAKLTEIKLIKEALLKEKIISDFDFTFYKTIVSLDKALVPKFIDYYQEVNYFKQQAKQVILTKSKNQSEQIYSIYEMIVKSLEAEVDINKIKIVNTNDSDDYQLQKLLNDAKIPLTINKAISISKYPIFKQFKKVFKTRSLAKAKEFLQNNQLQYPEVINKLINVFNRYSDSLIEANKSIFIYELDQLVIKPKKYSNSVEIINVDDINVYSDNYYLLANYIDDVFPKKIIDNDYLTDKQKAEINYYTSEELNHHNLNYYSHLLNSVKNLYLFMPEKIIDETRLARLTLKREIITKAYKYNVSSTTYLDKINYLRYAKLRYKWLNYNQESSDYLTLDKFYKTEFKQFNPQFKGIEKATLDALLEEYTITGAKIETLKLCPFQYFLKYLLRFGEAIDNHYLFFGNVIHKALENLAINPDYDYRELVYNQTDFPEDIFYKRNIFNDVLIDIIEYIAFETKKLHSKTLYNKLITEEKFSFKLAENDRFFIKGIIDKIMIDTENKYYAIIDYKFSDKTFSVSEFNRGLKQQLPFYLFAYNHLSDISPSGIFYQQTSKNREKVYKKSDNRLNGIYLNDVEQMKRFDPNGESVLGLSYTNSGLRKSPRALSETDFLQLLDKVRDYIYEAANKIESGDFKIDPILSEEQNNTSISCLYCEFASICYLKNKNVKGVNDEVYN